MCLNIWCLLGDVLGETRSILEVELLWRKWVSRGGAWKFYSKPTSCPLSVSRLGMQCEQLPQFHCLSCDELPILKP